MNSILLFQLLILSTGVTISRAELFVPISPCPDIFMYHWINTSQTWVAYVHVSPPKGQISIKLNVHLYLEAVLPTKYVGILELVEPRNVVLGRLKQSIMKPIVYIIKFPLPRPLPTVKNISVNNVPLCLGIPVMGPVITTIRLEHSLFPRMSRPQTQVQNLDSRHITESISNRGKPSNAGIMKYLEKDCGHPGLLVNPLIAGGKPVRIGQWPWLVAMFITQSAGLQFHCSATLVSDQFIVTAAHCMNHEETGQLTADSVLVYLGKYKLRNWTEPDSLLRQALEIHLHPEYNRYNFSSDIALVRFSPVIFTMNIRPACLWSRSPELGPYTGKMGTVVGWGRRSNETEISNEPQKVDLPIVSQEECLRSRADFVYLTSDKTMCAGSRNGIGPCNGDSGAGLLLLNENTSRWELRGIVSLSLIDPITGTCDLNEYVVFTDAGKYVDWIAEFIF